MRAVLLKSDAKVEQKWPWAADSTWSYNCDLEPKVIDQKQSKSKAKAQAKQK